ncbi:MAG: DNA repair protein RecO [Chloroflexi bacterium]|nr:DNA repair protein RecO [Chloroflexota bacterium]
MPASHLYRTEAIVLKRSDFGEADRIVTLYTPRLGKLRAIAKGVRRPKSRLGGHVELFIHSKMLLAKGRHLDIITQSENINSFTRLREDLRRTSLAYYVGELLDQFTEDGVENYLAFDLLVKTFERIGESRDPEVAARFFEVQLLGHLGYRPQLHTCIRCNITVGPTGNFFSAAAGGVLCLDCGQTDPRARGLTVNGFKMLRLLQSGDYATAVRVRLEPALRRELQAVTRNYIEFILERQLKSIGFLDALSANGFDAVASRP